MLTGSAQFGELVAPLYLLLVTFVEQLLKGTIPFAGAFRSTGVLRAWRRWSGAVQEANRMRTLAGIMTGRYKDGLLSKVLFNWRGWARNGKAQREAQTLKALAMLSGAGAPAPSAPSAPSARGGCPPLPRR